MASRYFLNIGANWGDTANWSDSSGGTGGFSVPTASDDVIFDANSGNCTVNASARVALTLTFTNYTNTITMSNTITVSGNVTLGASMGIAGSSALIINATCTFTSNGKTWSSALTFSSATTTTLSGNLTVTGTVTVQTGNHVLNSNTLFCQGNITLVSVRIEGTTLIDFNGTTTWTANNLSAEIRNSINISGTLNISGTVYYRIGTFTNNGTLNAGTSTFTINSTCTLDLKNATLYNVSMGGGGTITLSSNFTISNLLTTAVETWSGGTVNLSGSLTVGNTQGAGSTNFIFNGTGTWSGNQQFKCPLTINTAGTITVSGSVQYNTGTLTYTAGTVTTTGSTLTIAASTTLNTNGITWNNITFNGTNTTTLSSNLTLTGLLTNNATTTINGTFSINASGGLNTGGSLNQGTGTPSINLTGGTWSNNGGVYINTNINGNVTVSGSVFFGFRTLTYIGGTITTTGSTLNINNACTIDTGTVTVEMPNGILWNNVIFTANATLLSNLTVNGLLTFNNSTTLNGTYNINASGGLTVSALTTQGTGTTTINLTGGTWSGAGTLRNNLTINGNVTVSGTVNYNTGTLTYTAGTVTTTGSTLTIGANTTLNTNGMSWNNITLASCPILTLSSDLNINGTLTKNNTSTTQFNGSFNINLYGSLSMSDGFTSTVTTLNLLGSGNWYHDRSGISLSMNTTINCSGTYTVTSSLIVFNSTATTATFTYQAGTINFNNCLFVINGSATLNTNVLPLPRVQFNVNSVNSRTLTLSSDLICTSLETGGSGSSTATFNGFNVITNSIILYITDGTVAGTTTFNMVGEGTLSMSSVTTGSLKNNLVINTGGTVTFSGTIAYNTGTFTYTRGKLRFINNPTLTVSASSTFINCDRLTFNTITITAGTTQTMNKMFDGLANKPTRIQSTSTTSNYTIAFQDGIEKMTYNTQISNCTVSRPGQLLCLSKSANKGGNSGLRYWNSAPNGLPVNMGVNTNMIYGIANISDPTFVLN